MKKKTPAWQRKEGQNKAGGLNEKGRKSYEAANPGSNLKPPQPEGGPRKDSFCASMGQQGFWELKPDVSRRLLEALGLRAEEIARMEMVK